jgi:hypothetical protein
MDKHSDRVAYDGGASKLAVDLGNLRYDALADFLQRLSAKLANDSGADAARGRVNLARNLAEAAAHVAKAGNCIEEAWRIAEPHMPKEDGDG